MATAIRASVTVSIAEETSGRRSVIPRLSLAAVSASPGRISEWAGSSRTSSKVNAGGPNLVWSVMAPSGKGVRSRQSSDGPSGGSPAAPKPGRLAGPSPAELGEAGVVDAEVVADLVHDRAPHLLDHIVLGLADGADREAVDGDPVRQHPRVTRRPAGERDSLVEPEQARRARRVLDRDRHVAHQAAQLLRQAVERLPDHFLEPGRIHLDHEPRAR